MSSKSENLRFLRLEADSRTAAAESVGPVEKAKHELLARHYAARARAELKS
jgi:hypothetical protein